MIGIPGLGLPERTLIGSWLWKNLLREINCFTDQAKYMAPYWLKYQNCYLIPIKVTVSVDVARIIFIDITRGKIFMIKLDSLD